jgi:glycosyltransferase involved in cell wall biosynthesis
MPAERERLGVPADAPFFGTAGRLSPEKNHMDFIRAAAIVAGKLPAARFVVWGEGFLRPRLERAVSDLGLGGRFHLPGFNRDARRAFHELDVFVLPSLTEGLSNVLLEAFACAKPAVATAVGGNPEVVEDGVSGILVPPGDPEALAGAMLRLAVEPRTRAAMGRAGAMSVRANFDFDGQTRRYVALYLGLVGSGRAAA